MRDPRLIEVTAPVVFRVVNAGWSDPLDTSYAAAKGGRWNPPGIGALYTFASRRPARTYAWEKLADPPVVPEDLRPDSRPQLVEVCWNGVAVDVATPAGVVAAGFAADYPKDVDWAKTQPRGRGWHADRREGVQCRSATLHRAGETKWAGDPSDWSEVVVFADTAAVRPVLARRIDGLDFLY